MVEGLRREMMQMKLRAQPEGVGLMKSYQKEVVGVVVGNGCHMGRMLDVLLMVEVRQFQSHK